MLITKHKATSWIRFIKVRLCCTFGALVLMSTSWCTTIDKNTTSDKTAQLNQINQSIQNLQQTLSKDRDTQQQLHQQLQTTEQAVTQINQRLNGINQQLNQQQTTLKSLSSNQQQYQENLQQQTEHMVEQLRAAYILSRYEYWQILFSQQDPTELSRLLSYYRYLNSARSEFMNQLQDHLKTLQDQRAVLQKQQSVIKQSLQQQQRDQIKLIFMEQRHKQLLNQLGQKIQTNNQLLTQRLADKRALEAVLQKLQINSNNIPFPNSGTPLNKLQGKLPWPTAGKVTKQFGSDIGGSDLRYSGVLLSATQGQAVHAVYAGKVVFANWLQGFGLLMILDHGNGFMTLYGHNQTLTQKVGSFVKAGDILATVGNSGSTGEPSGLYFEIRQHGKPLNPSQWCR